MSDNQPAASSDDRLWSAEDVAQEYDHGVEWARHALARWAAAGAVEVVSHDSITKARLYNPGQVRAARTTDLTG